MQSTGGHSCQDGHCFQGEERDPTVKKHKEQRRKNVSIISQLVSNRVSFFWRPEKKLWRLHRDFYFIKNQFRLGHITLEKFLDEKKKVVSWVGDLKQYLRRHDTWVSAFTADRKTGEIRWGAAKWRPDESNLVMTNLIRTKLKIWASERLHSKLVRIFYVSPFEYSTPADLAVDKEDYKNQLTSWYRNIEALIGRKIYSDGMTKAIEPPVHLAVPKIKDYVDNAALLLSSVRGFVNSLQENLSAFQEMDAKSLGSIYHMISTARECIDRNVEDMKCPRSATKLSSKELGTSGHVMHEDIIIVSRSLMNSLYAQENIHIDMLEEMREKNQELAECIRHLRNSEPSPSRISRSRE
jgi:hypothetical protein